MTTEDRELLEWAAKSVGIKLEINVYGSGNYDAGFWTAYGGIGRHSWYPWDPIKDDGDALRLAVKLALRIDYCSVLYVAQKPSCWVSWVPGGMKNRITQVLYEFDNDPCAATRRAIVKAAAEIGRRMA